MGKTKKKYVGYLNELYGAMDSSAAWLELKYLCKSSSPTAVSQETLQTFIKNCTCGELVRMCDREKFNKDFKAWKGGDK